MLQMSHPSTIQVVESVTSGFGGDDVEEMAEELIIDNDDTPWSVEE